MLKMPSEINCVGSSSGQPWCRDPQGAVDPVEMALGGQGHRSSLRDGAEEKGTEGQSLG